MGFLPRPLLFSSLAVVILPMAFSGNTIYCTAGDFAAGEKALLTCHFPLDIYAHDSVYIQYHPLSDPTKDGEVLLCKVEDLKASTCKGKGRYVLMGHSDRNLSVGIPNMTDEAAEQYVCQFLPPDSSKIEPCKLTVRAVRPGNAKERPSTNLQTDVTGTRCVGVGVGVGVTVAVCFLATAIFFIIYRRNRLKIRGCGRDDSDDSENGATSQPLIDRSINTTSVRRPLFGSQVSVESYMEPLVKDDEKETVGALLIQVDRSVRKPLYERQASVESYMKPLVKYDEKERFGVPLIQIDSTNGATSQPLIDRFMNQTIRSIRKPLYERQASVESYMEPLVKHDEKEL